MLENNIWGEKVDKIRGSNMRFKIFIQADHETEALVVYDECMSGYDAYYEDGEWSYRHR